MRKKLLVIIPAGLLALCVLAAGVYYAIEGYGGMFMLFGPTLDLSNTMRAETYTHEDGTMLPYRIYVPESQNALPLVLSLHGSGGRGNNNRAQIGQNSVMQVLLNDENRVAFPAIVLAPQCPADTSWQDITAQLMGLLEYVIASHPADPNRVYITGYSMGGNGTWAMLAAYPEFFAAAVPICGWGEPETAYRFSGVPIWAFHGKRDPSVSVEGTREMIAALEAVNAPYVRYTEYRHERHMSWHKAYREAELFPWMFGQVRQD